MNRNVTLAVTRLQARRRRHHGPWAADQIEEAMDLLLKQPHNNAPPGDQVRDALREASRKLAKRQRLFGLNRARIQSATISDHALGVVEFELRDFIDREVRPTDRPLLKVVMAGGSSEEIARLFRISPPRARERLSRARARAYKLWIN